METEYLLHKVIIKQVDKQSHNDTTTSLLSFNDYNT